ncbi:hypothetical protein [Croceitalea rosinachiae]|uniref:Uncharacterized protein n=1 Tax=Croceitalea rosinachiae TaxID=3075596 RepID=A0ABU3A7F7_9FLAO|nr:hypothetical protein [Croceitalea sp. F388]MDT0606102.1 hypothetical protein [Croceitalea sp. F388]
MNDKINPHELTLTISLAKEDQKRMQLVYASQLYGTFFGVFGSFEIDYSDKEKLKIKGVHLRLINYKGVINLGIAGVAKTLERIPNSDGQDELTLHFKVQALRKPDVLRYYGFTNEEEIMNGERLIFRRKLINLNADPTTGLNGGGVYDSEFYERDGLYNRKRALRMDDEEETGWGYDQHTGRRHKPKNIPESLTTRSFDKIEFGEGEIVSKFSYVNSKGDTFEPKALGGRCPKTLSIAKY